MVRVIVADMIAGGVRVRGEAGGANRGEDRGGGNAIGIEGDVDAAADQIEIEREDAGPGERMAHQRRFVGAVHACHVQANLRAAWTAASTSSAWPSTFTPSHRFATLPSGPIRYVVRATPMYFLPYIDFSCHTPYLSITAWSSSASSGNFSPYFSANFALLFESRTLTPSTAALLFLNFGRLSWNAHDSVVQPGVSSFG